MDELYILKVRGGDTDAFRYFVSKYKDMAFSIAVSVIKDEFLAEEIVQDAFLKAFNALGSFQERSKFSSWFYRIVVNESFQKLKRIQKEPVVYRQDTALESEDEGIPLSLQLEEQTYLINKALDRLAPKESLALRLFYLQEESIKEVGDLTGWSESNVKVILFRARKNMALALREILNAEFK